MTKYEFIDHLSVYTLQHYELSLSLVHDAEYDEDYIQSRWNGRIHEWYFDDNIDMDEFKEEAYKLVNDRIRKWGLRDKG